MFDISYIIECNDNTDNICHILDPVVSILNYSDGIEIIILNFSKSGKLNSMISYYENKWPNNILIINLDTPTDLDSLIKIGIDYSDCLCYLYLPTDIKRINEDTYDLLVASDICNSDKYKYIKDKYIYISMSAGKSSFTFDQKNEMPMITDYRDSAGTIDNHYFFQDIYVAQKIHSQGIKHVFDIGSRVDGYISHLLTMKIKVTMIDIRPLPVYIDNLEFIQGDAISLSNIETGSIPVLSCLHALEHFGLGRYGDPLDYDGWNKALSAFKRVISPDGFLYISVPVGICETVMFNAHRIFNPLTIIDNLIPEFNLLEFTLLHNGTRSTFNFTHNKSRKKIVTTISDIKKNIMGSFDCGIFVFQKL